jgi:hypothetical protein
MPVKRETDNSFDEGDSADLLESLVANERMCYGQFQYFTSLKPKLMHNSRNSYIKATKENDMTSLAEISVSEHSSTLDKSC